MSLKDRQWGFVRQGLDQVRAVYPSASLESTGWSRSVGGVNPYLALFARTGAAKDQVDRAGSAMELYELPSTRGCTYVVPAAHYALALRLAQGFVDRAPLQTAVKFLGVTEAEVDLLQQAILDALGDETLMPNELRDQLGDKVRNLGEAGKKRGQTTTLSLGLAPLQTHGRIVRVPVGGGLETQRYGYRRWVNGPDPSAISLEQAMRDFARLYFSWAGPATVKQFQWMTGRTVAQCKQAIEDAGLVKVDADRYLAPELVDDYRDFRGEPDRVVLVGSLDNLFHLRGDLESMIDPAAEGFQIPGDKGLLDASGLRDLTSHAIIRGGALVGVWEYEPSSGEIVALAFKDLGAELREAVDVTHAMVREHLGDCRSFSLDSPASRQPRIDALRRMARP